MSSYISYLLRPHMIIILVAVFVLAAGGTWLFRDRLRTRSRLVWFFATVVSVGGLFQVTLFREESWGLFFDHIFVWDTDSLMKGIIGTDTLLNIVLFIPAGLFATLLWRHPFRVSGIAVLVSTLVECFQAVFGIGSNAVLDIVANSLGALFGSWLGWASYLGYGWVRNKKVDAAPFAKLVTTIAILAGICFGGSALGAGVRQESLANDLEAAFAGTTFEDYKAWDSAEN
ncbi:MAG: VanZ family protein, partial [Propionibacteriaceae bacterium]|nr:VanZ family protein [Propionibacteriaceae bacterium]